MGLTIAALGVGGLTLAAWLWIDGSWSTAIERAVTVMVIACPHALGLAIPLVVVNAAGLAARSGILVRNREAFERARDLRAVAFDKTGTLTEGRFEVRRVAGALPEPEALRLGSALERASEHPLAVAIVEAAAARGVAAAAAAGVRAVPGKGLAGSVDGRAYRIGRPEWVRELGLPRTAAIDEAIAEADARGESVIVLMNDAGALTASGVDVVMITGDAHAVATTVAADLGIARYHARVLPHEKAALIARARTDLGPTAFVGDGINDAPALREADLGVAIGAGTNVAIESADLVLVENDPMDVVRGLRLSRLTYRKMRQNLWWAAGYNVAAIPLAAGVGAAWGLVLTPAMGAVFMSVSTVVVALNAALLHRARLG
jgi:Cu2+-exporting ATPase